MSKFIGARHVCPDGEETGVYYDEINTTEAPASRIDTNAGVTDQIAAIYGTFATDADVLSRKLGHALLNHSWGDDEADDMQASTVYLWLRLMDALNSLTQEVYNDCADLPCLANASVTEADLALDDLLDELVAKHGNDKLEMAEGI